MRLVDFYYAIGSRYSYLASSQLARIQAETARSLDWHPLNSVRLLSARGKSPFEEEPVSGQYDWGYRERDASRWAAVYKIPFVESRGRVRFDSDLLALACTAAKRLGRVERFSHRLFAAMFHGRVDQIGEAECVAAAAACGVNGDDFTVELHSPDTARQLSGTTEAALEAGVFGVPTFIADGELFWGNDRLVLLEHHLCERAV